MKSGSETTIAASNHRVAPFECLLAASRCFAGADTDSIFFKRDFSSQEIHDYAREKILSRAEFRRGASANGVPVHGRISRHKR